MESIPEIQVGVELLPRTQEASEGSRTAFRQALALAEQTGARLTVLHSTWHEGEVVPLTDAGRAALDALVTEAIGAGRVARLEVTDQRAWLALLRAAARGEAGMVVVGKRDALQGPTERRLGSVATKLVRKCPAPVWVVKPGHDLDHKLVLAATDLTPVGDRALAWAASVARWREAALHVVHAWRLSPEERQRARDLDPAAWEGELEELRAEVRASVLERCEGLDLPEVPTLHLSRKTPASAIREAVEHLVPDLLVMGSLSRGGRAGVLVGETAERLVSRLDCSMLVLKPDDFVSPVPAD